jgi:O-antigen/teichoic acid export membrane protein
MTRPSAATRDALALGLSTACSSGLYLLALPLLARGYSPREFGAYGSYAALMAVFGTIVSLRFESGIPVARTASGALNLAVIGSLAVCVSAALWPLALWALRAAGVPGLDRLVPVPAIVLAMGIGFQGTLQVATHVAVRQGRFVGMSVSRVAQSMTQISVQAVTLALPLGGLGLMVGDIAGRASGTLVLAHRHRLPAVAPSVQSLRETAREYSHLPLQMAPATLLTMVASQLPLLGLPFIFGQELAGQYFFAYRLTYMPAALLIAGAAPMLLGRLGRLEDPRAQNAAVRVSAIWLALIAVPFYVGIGLVAPTAMNTVLGGAWQETGVVARALAPAAAVWAIASPLSSIMIVKARGAEALMFSAVDVGLKLACLVAGAWLDSFSATVWLLAGTGTVLGSVSIVRFLAAARPPLHGLASSNVAAQVAT